MLIVHTGAQIYGDIQYKLKCVHFPCNTDVGNETWTIIEKLSIIEQYIYIYIKWARSNNKKIDRVTN